VVERAKVPAVVGLNACMRTEHEVDGGRGASSDDPLFRVVANSASDSIITIDRNSIILFTNPATEHIFGYSQQDLIGQSLTMLMPDYLRHVHEAALDRYLRTGEKHLHWGGVQVPGLHRSGRQIPLELSFGEIVNDGEHLFTGVIRDISERRKAERRLEAQYSVAHALTLAESFDAAAPQVLEGICRHLDWKVGLLWRFEPNSGRLSATSEWHDGSAGAQAFLAATRARSFAPGEGLPGRAFESGKAIWIENVEQDDNYPRRPQAHEAGLHAALGVPIAADGPVVAVMEFITPDIREPDEGLMNLLTSVAAQIGQFIRRNRAEQKVLELNRVLEDRVRERTSQLLESNDQLESFSYSVSHDLRGPLRGIDGFSQIMLEDYGPELDEKATGYLTRIRSAARRMGGLIDDLLELSRISRTELTRKEVDLGALAWQIAKDLVETEPRRQVEFVIAENLFAQCDPRLIRIALENLIKNSWKFTEKVDTPRIEVGSIPRPGGIVYFVRDNGAGFDMTYADRLFEPFQRLHSPGEYEGSGVGLTTVRRIVVRHGGEIWAESAPDSGATFFFTL
jgi:PAS domain S-box-containing protein